MINKILMLSNLGIDLGRPDFRLGAYTHYLFPLAYNLSKDKSLNIKVMANTYIYNSLLNYMSKNHLNLEFLTLFDEENIPSRLLNFLLDSYGKEFSQDEKSIIRSIIIEALGRNWIPDVIFVWETPSYFLREIFPNALVLDLMPGMFARPPFPKMISLDPVGLYKDCWFKDQDIRGYTQNNTYIEEFKRLKALFRTHFNNINSMLTVENIGKHGKNKILAPLQISNYFSWFENCVFSNQFDYVLQLLRSIPSDHEVIFTQYTGSFVSERVINDNNIDYLQKKFDQFFYDKKFDKIDNISQYILPNVESVCTVSSTLGLQAKFFDKKLISPSNSHLAYLADSTLLQNSSSTKNNNIEPFMATLLGRTQFLQSRLNNDYRYLRGILDSFYQRKNESGIEKYPSFLEVENNYVNLASASNFTRSESIFKKVYQCKMNRADHIINEHKKSITRSQVDVISFDVFDTLIGRIVMNPLDVFYLMSAQLFRTHKDKLGMNFIQNFVKYRVGAEKLLRFTLDKNKIDLSCEEMCVHDVYIKALQQANIETSFAQELVAIEQDIELQVLKPRSAGLQIYLSALNSGKEIIIISDFIHPASFVEKVLKHCGYYDWKKVYVSSEVGLKKHSGRLYEYVCEDLNLDKARLLHFGDNPHGDIKMAEKKSINARLLKSAPVIIKQLIIERKFNLNAINNSIITRTIFCIFAHKFLQLGGSRHQDTKNVQLITNQKEFGFLVIGPMMNAFAKWILNQAKINQIEQILFFARDTHLPYKIIKKIQEKQKNSSLNICYLPVSRTSTTGLDIFSPEDVINININDFNKAAKLSELLRVRFLLKEEEISIAAVNHWIKKDINKIKVGDLSTLHLAIYEIAKQSYIENWNIISKRLEEKRQIFLSALQQWGVDITKKSIVVDFGYKGTIYKKIKKLFNHPLLPLFFMSYASELGAKPIEYAKTFYKSNLISQRKDNISFLKYNLMLETMVNEPDGSVLGYQNDSNNIVKVIRDKDTIDSNHICIIKEIHSGALEFADYWNQHCKILDENAEYENAMLDFIFESILKKPSIREAELLSDLIFDNGYAGHEFRRFIEKNKKNKITKKGLWLEGIKTLAREPQRRGAHSVFKNIIHKIVRLFVKRLCNQRLLSKYDRDPKAFFFDSSNKYVRDFGAVMIKD